MKKIITVLLLAALALSLVACQGQDYKEAMELFNAGDYTAAETVFAALGDFENSAEMVNKCRYERAKLLFDAKDYAAALPIYQQLGDYEDCKTQVSWCNYRLAELAMEEKDYAKAAQLYLQLGDFEQSVARETEARRLLLEKYVQDKGGQVSGKYTAEDGKEYAITILADKNNPGLVTLRCVYTYTRVAVFTNEVNLAVPFDQAAGRVEASFVMNLNFGGSVSITSETFRGSLTFADFTAETPVTLETYSKYEQDGSSYKESNDISKAPVAELNAQVYNMLRGADKLLQELKLGVDLADLGLTAWNQ